MKKTVDMNINSLPMIHVCNHEAPKSLADNGKDVGWKAAAAGAVALATVGTTWLAKKIFRNKPEVTETHVYNHDANEVTTIASEALEKAEAEAPAASEKKPETK